MLIRDYTPRDRDRCLEIFRTNMPLFFDAEELPQFETWLDKEITREKSDDHIIHYYVMELAGVVIGCGGFYLDQQKNQAGMIWGMVSQAHHRKGFGKKLLTFRIEMIRSLNPGAEILLDTSQHSYVFFEKMSFKVTAITKDYYGKGLDRYDMRNNDQSPTINS